MPPDDHPPPPYPTQVAIQSRKHSALGIASFITSIIAGFLLLGGFVVAGILHSTGNYEKSAQMVVGFVLIFATGAEIVALGLGIAGLCQRSTNKILSILGTVFSVTAIVGTIFLMIIGLAAQ